MIKGEQRETRRESKKRKEQLKNNRKAIWLLQSVVGPKKGGEEV